MLPSRRRRRNIALRGAAASIGESHDRTSDVGNGSIVRFLKFVMAALIGMVCGMIKLGVRTKLSVCDKFWSVASAPKIRIRYGRRYLHLFLRLLPVRARDFRGFPSSSPATQGTPSAGSPCAPPRLQSVCVGRCCPRKEGIKGGGGGFLMFLAIFSPSSSSIPLCLSSSRNKVGLLILAPESKKGAVVRACVRARAGGREAGRTTVLRVSC